MELSEFLSKARIIFDVMQNQSLKKAFDGLDQMEQEKLACEKKITRLQQTVETMKQSLKHSEKQEVSC